MSQSIAIDRGRLELERRHHHDFITGTLLGLILGLLVFGVVVTAFSALRTALLQRPAGAEVPGAYPADESPAVYPAPELSREWRWEPKGFETESMYRHKGAPQLDWYRKGQSRKWRQDH